MIRILALMSLLYTLSLSGLALGAGLPDNANVMEYSSPAVGLRLKYTALLPQGYGQSADRYPVLYLLHGHTGNHTSWLTYAGLSADAPTRLGAIVILVDGGNGFYTNWKGAKGDRPQRWADAITQDLVPEVDRRWRTRSDRAHRAIGGMSMGGYGAITLALAHPDLFAVAFSSAGALRFAERARDELRNGTDDWNRPELWSSDERPPVAIKGFASQRERTPRGRVFTTGAQTRSADPFVLAERIEPARAPYLHLDCGLEDTLLPETEAFAALLRRRSIRHSVFRLPGDHEVPYWAHAFEHTLIMLKRAFAADASGAPAGKATLPQRESRE